MISINNISKTFEKGAVSALEDINIKIGKGELFGLIGPDGAGKSTLFRILATLLLPDKGSATIDGRDVVQDFKAIRKTIGYMPGRFSLYQDLSVEENLEFYATVFGTTVAENYAQIKPIYSQIEPFKKRRAGALSGGMKQKLALSCALIHQPELLLLDEPTTGVDPVSRKEFWDILALLKAQGLTIVVSTPYMDEATRCDRIALIQKGRILDQDTPEGIIQRNQSNLFRLRGDNMAALLTQARQWPGTQSCYAFGDSHHISLSAKAKPADLKAFLSNNGFSNLELDAILPGIEDVFIGLMNSKM
jgi:ABC-2 type transport system ATP-binding protein